jgi:hypothetical protein
VKRYSVEPNEPLLSEASSLEEVVALRERMDVVVVLLDLGIVVLLNIALENTGGSAI